MAGKKHLKRHISGVFDFSGTGGPVDLSGLKDGLPVIYSSHADFEIVEDSDVDEETGLSFTSPEGPDANEAEAELFASFSGAHAARPAKDEVDEDEESSDTPEADKRDGKAKSKAKKRAKDGSDEDESTKDGSEFKLFGRLHIDLFIVLVALIGISLLLFLSYRFLFDSWETLSIDEIIYHLHASMDGTDPTLIIRYVSRYLSSALGLTAAAGFGLNKLQKESENYRKIFHGVALASCALLVYTLFSFANKTHLFSYLQGAGEEDFIADHYVDPAEVELVFPEQKRNLIYIYLESMETTFADQANGGGFEFNCIPELTELSQRYENFSGSSSELNGGVPLEGATWTMGGLFAQTSGLPLKISVGTNMMAGNESFFPGITSLGDILEAEGYTQELLIGSDAEFGGRNIYFETHGDYKMHDLVYVKKEEGKIIPPEESNEWGMNDVLLFEEAREELTRLASLGQPFNLTMLTVDTHFPDGFVCSLCDTEFGDNQYANVFACSSRQVTEFVNWIQQQDFYENTTIILNGDHTTMDNDFCENVSPDYLRKTYTTIINPAPATAESFAAAQGEAEQQPRLYSTFDMFPTTLAALGVEIPGNQLGVGVNLYSGDKTLLETVGVSAAQEELARPSRFMDRLSGVGVDSKVMERAARHTRISITENEDGTLHLDSAEMRGLAADSISSFEYEISDLKTGERYVVTGKPVADEFNPGLTRCVVDADVPLSNRSDFHVDLYINTDDFKHYRVSRRYGTKNPFAPFIDSDGQAEIENGCYVLASAEIEGLCVALDGWTYSNAGNMLAAERTGAANQLFRITKDDETGFYRLTNVFSSKFLDVDSGDPLGGTNIQQWDEATAANANNQLWKIVQVEDGSYTLQNIASGLLLSIASKETVNPETENSYRNIEGGLPEDTNNKTWQLQRVEDPYSTMQRIADENRYAISDGTYTITPYSTSTLALDVDGGATNNGANVWLYERAYNNVQKWTVAHDEQGFVILTNVNSGLALDVWAGITAPRTNVHQYESNGGLAQKWVVIPNAEGGYELMSALFPDVMLDMHGDTPVSGTNVQVFPRNNGSTQRWRFINANAAASTRRS